MGAPLIIRQLRKFPARSKASLYHKLYCTRLVREFFCRPLRPNWCPSKVLSNIGNKVAGPGCKTNTARTSSAPTSARTALAAPAHRAPTPCATPSGRPRPTPSSEKFRALRARNFPGHWELAPFPDPCGKGYIFWTPSIFSDGAPPSIPAGLCSPAPATVTFTETASSRT